MKNTFGNSISVTLFGESHGEAIGAVIDGLCPGIEIDDEFITKKLSLRKSDGAISTKRREKDEYRIVSGVFNGKTTGTPLCIVIENGDVKSADYEKSADLLRPSHADYTAECKYHGFQDYRGGGHFSGRLTAPIVAAGAIAMKMLEKKGVIIATHIKQLGDITDRDFADFSADAEYLSNEKFPVLDIGAKEKMYSLITESAKQGDSVGGILESVVHGMPCGVGEPWFDTVESQLAHMIFSVPAVKGIEFGAGFGFANMKGSQANDAFEVKDGKIRTVTNNNGGINGGITNGEDIVFRCAVKPTPSIFKEQNTVNIKTMENTKLSLSGRHDPAVIHRARVVIDSVSALCLADLLAQRFGTDCFTE